LNRQQDEDNEENGCEIMMSSSSELVSDDFQKSHKPKLQHKLVVPVPKGATRNHSSDSQSTESKSSSHGMLTVDLSKLDPAALWRYWRHFNLADVSLNSSKEQLVNAVEKHFISEQLDELQVIAGFVQAAKRLKRVCA